MRRKKATRRKSQKPILHTAPCHWDSSLVTVHDAARDSFFERTPPLLPYYCVKSGVKPDDVPAVWKDYCDRLKQPSPFGNKRHI